MSRKPPLTSALSSPARAFLRVLRGQSQHGPSAVRLGIISPLLPALKPLVLEWSGPSSLHRLRSQLSSGSPLLQAIKKATPRQGSTIVVDCTAGLGRDSLLIAASGFRLIAIEKSWPLAVLIADEILRSRADPSCPLTNICHNIAFVHSSAEDFWQKLTAESPLLPPPFVISSRQALWDLAGISLEPSSPPVAVDTGLGNAFVVDFADESLFSAQFRDAPLMAFLDPMWRTELGERPGKCKTQQAGVIQYLELLSGPSNSDEVKTLIATIGSALAPKRVDRSPPRPFLVLKQHLAAPPLLPSSPNEKREKLLSTIKAPSVVRFDLIGR